MNEAEAGPASTEAGSEARRYGKTAGLLSIGVGLTGLITYAYFSFAAHTLSKTQYGEIAVLWSAVFITVSTLYRPVEQLLSRTIAERQTHDQPIGQPMRVAATIQLALGAVFVAGALIFREPIQDNLLSGNETLYWILVATVLAYAASYFARGFLAGSRRFPLYAGLIMAESISRTLFAVAVVIGISSGQTAVALGIVAAPVFSLIVVPAAFVRRASTTAERTDYLTAPEGDREELGEVESGVNLEAGAGPDSDKSKSAAAVGGGAGDGPNANPDPEFTLAHGGMFAGAVLLIMFSEQTFLNAGPLLIKGTAGVAAAGYIFNILMIARAPLQLFQAISTSLLPHLTSLRARSQRSGEPTGEEAFRLSVRVTLAAVAAFASAVTVVMLAIGPALMQIAFSKKYTYQRIDLVIVSIGMGLYLASVTLNQAALAQGQVRRASLIWISCAAGFVVWNLVPVLSPVRRVEVGFVGVAAILCGGLYLLYRRPHVRAEDVIEPGSIEEMEATLAAADEGS